MIAGSMLMAWQVTRPRAIVAETTLGAATEEFE
jgi:hypothetical protein